MNKSESIAELAKSLASFQKEVKQPQKNGVNPHFKSRYVTLDDTIKAINETAPKHGLAYIQTPINDDNGIGVVTIILHESGQYIEFPSFTLPLDKKTAQGSGSALTYARRYSISSAFGLVSEDDDDANATTPQQPKSVQPKVDTMEPLKTKWKTLAGTMDGFDEFYDNQQTAKYSDQQIDVFLSKKLQAKNKSA